MWMQCFNLTSLMARESLSCCYLAEARVWRTAQQSHLVQNEREDSRSDTEEEWVSGDSGNHPLAISRAIHLDQIDLAGTAGNELCTRHLHGFCRKFAEHTRQFKEQWIVLSCKGVELLRWTQLSFGAQLPLADHVHDLDARDGDRR